jgi:hypothetical protein
MSEAHIPPTPSQALSDYLANNTFGDVDRLHRLCVRYSNRMSARKDEYVDDSDQEFNGKFDKIYDKVEKRRQLELESLIKRFIERVYVYFTTVLEPESIAIVCGSKAMGQQIADKINGDRSRPAEENRPRIWAFYEQSSAQIELLNYDPDAVKTEGRNSDEDYASDSSEENARRILNPPDVIQRINELIDPQLSRAPETPAALMVQDIAFEPLSLELRVIDGTEEKENAAETFQIGIATTTRTYTTIPKQIEVKHGDAFTLKVDRPTDIITLMCRATNSWGTSETRVFQLLPNFTPKAFSKAFIKTDNQYDQVLTSDVIGFEMVSSGGDETNSQVYRLDWKNPPNIFPFNDIFVAQNVVAQFSSGDVVEWGHMVQFNEEDDALNNPPMTNLEAVTVGVYPGISQLTSEKVIQITGGNHFCLFLSVFGTIYSWGTNDYGQLGTGDMFGRVNPEPICNLPAFRLIAAKSNNCLAIDIEENVYVWGESMQPFVTIRGPKDQPCLVSLNKNEICQKEPRRVFSFPHYVKKAECGECFNVVLTEEGDLYTWGANEKGELGFDRPNGDYLPYCDLPHKLDLKGQKVQQFTVGTSHVLIETIGEKGERSVQGFGFNDFGQLKPNSPHGGSIRSPQYLGVDNVERFWAAGNSSIFLTENKPLVFGELNGIFGFLTATSEIRFLSPDSAVVLQR